MIFDGLPPFLAACRSELYRAPAALVLAEDGVELGSTLRHLAGLGFGVIAVFCDDLTAWPEDAPEIAHRIRWQIYQEDALFRAVNQVIAAAPGAWLHYCYNAEYLYYPFCETRSVQDLVTFHSEERRDALMTYVIDLYAGDFTTHPNGISREAALLDRSGYYALGREDATNAYAPLERQMDFYGGLRWRFEEHIPWERRRIDRISLFRATEGLALRPDYTFNVAEYNTYACPWHHSITAAVCSFRTAKALRANPGSRYAIKSFVWRNSAPFSWQSSQLMDMGLMEPGQWF